VTQVPLNGLLQQLHENHLELRRNFLALMASQQALLEQLHEHGLIDPDRWQRDKVRHTQAYEQLAAKKDDEQLQEQAEAQRRQLRRPPGPAGSGVVRFRPSVEPSDDDGPEAA